MNAMGLDLNGVSNHEFDEDIDELLRLESGGCHPDFGCFGDIPFAGAAFEFLGANVVDRAGGAPLFTPYVLREFEGVPVAFIGLTLRDRPSTTTPIRTLMIRTMTIRTMTIRTLTIRTMTRSATRM